MCTTKEVPMTDLAPSRWLDGVSGLQRAEGESVAEQIAGVLRSQIIQGRIQPGVRLSEEAIAASLDVSRNSLREAFRLLAHDRLLKHEKNRGVFVRELDAASVREIYQLRLTLELAALEGARATGRSDARALRDAVNAGLTAAVKDEWSDVGTANAAFHQAVAGLAGNSRVDEVMSQLMAELRLAFHVMHPIKDFFSPYLPDNVRICEFVEQGKWEEAAAALRSYSERAESQLLRALLALESDPLTATGT